MEEFISAIDIGTTKICALTAGVTHDSLGNLALRILGEVTEWRRQTPEQIRDWREKLANNRGEIIN